MRKISLLNILKLMLLSVVIGGGSNALADSKLFSMEKPDSGFLPDYSLLKPVKSPEGTKAYRYEKFDFDPLMYHAVIIDPVIINQSEADEKITSEVVEQTRLALDASIRDRIGQSRLKIAHEPGPDVLRVSVAISGAELEKEGFKPRNILPISAAIKAASYVVGKDKKIPVLLVESKITNSQSGDLVRAGMLSVSGETFRGQDKTIAVFQVLAQRIVGIAKGNSNR